MKESALKRMRQSFVRFLRSYFTWSGWKEFMPKGRLQWISALLLLTFFCTYASYWVYNNRIVFTDTMRHDDDVRIHVMPMHRYDGHGTLKDDPVALDMLAFATLGFRLVHMVSVPLVGLTAAPKFTIILCYLLSLVAMIITLRSKQAGLAAAVLLGFLFLHTDKITRTVTSGVERAFAFPVLALWIAGVLAGSRRARFFAIILGTLTYPAVMAVALAAEGLLILKDGIRLKSRDFWLQLRTYAILAVACVVVLQIDSFTKPDAGRLPTLEQATANPAFGPQGRTTRVPLMNPESEICNTIGKFFAKGADNKFWPGSLSYFGLEGTGPMLVFSLLILLCVFRISPKPYPAAALFCGCVFLYFLARVYAFRLLYIPHRYLSYGIMATGLTLIVYSIGLVGDRIADPHARAAVRNLVTAAAIGIGILLTGDHLEADASINIDGHVHEPLWRYMGNLPKKETRIAAHPADADSISFWTGRAATPGVEQSIPWFDESWERNSAKAKDALRLVYATRKEDVFAICERQKATHILLNIRKYTNNFREESVTFEPLTTFTLDLLKNVELSDLLFADPPDEASLAKYAEYNLIDVEKLKEVWAESYRSIGVSE